jgi:hypothetical protein
VTGPPDDESRALGSPASAEESHNSTPAKPDRSAAAVRQCSATPLNRRREAARRLPVLGESGRSDPWHYEDGSALRGYEDAAHHLLGYGLMPAPNPVALRAMWHCGGESRRVAERIAECWELTA